MIHPHPSPVEYSVSPHLYPAPLPDSLSTPPPPIPHSIYPPPPTAAPPPPARAPQLQSARPASKAKGDSSPIPIGARPFRSRKQRPCDNCRRSKTRCFINEEGPPCVECKQTGRACTFEEAPQKRKRRPPEDAPSMQPAPAGTTGALHTTGLGPVRSVSAGRRSRADSTSTGVYHAETPTESSRSASISSSSGVPTISYPSAEVNNLSSLFTSLDLSTPESHEPHIMYSPPDDVSLLLPPSPSYVRQLSLDASRPAYAVFEPKPHYRTSLDPGLSLLAQVDQLLNTLSPRPQNAHLLETYLNVVHPAFPLLPDTRQPLPSYLLGAVYSSALIHIPSLRGTSIRAWAILHVAVDPDFDKPRLSTIAANLLDMNGRPSMDPRGNYQILARTIAQAQLLGLHLDPTSWSIPTWERDLRIRLWWGCMIHDSWICLYDSRPSHIHRNDTDVSLPSLASLPPPAASGRAFRSLCELCRIMMRLQEELCSVAALRTRSPRDRAARIAAFEEEVAVFAVESVIHEKAPGTLSLSLEILGLRLFLRRMALDPDPDDPAPPDANTLDLVRQATDFVTGLSDADLNGFWTIYASHHISTLLNFLLRLALSPSAPPTEYPSPHGTRTSVPLGLLTRLISFLQHTSSAHQWDLASRALSRAASASERLRERGGSEDIVAALEGRPPTVEPHYHPPPPPQGWDFGIDWSSWAGLESPHDVQQHHAGAPSHLGGGWGLQSPRHLNAAPGW